MPYKDPEVRRQKRREWYHKTRDTRVEYQRLYEEKTKPVRVAKGRLTHVKRTYNLDAEEYLQMILDQGNVCAICGKAETCTNRHGDVRPLAVDHCHTTGKVRGLLCARCNGMLGCASDDINVLLNAIEYLKAQED